MEKIKFAQVCISKSSGLKKGERLPLGNLITYAKGTWNIPEEKAKEIKRLEVYNKGEFLGAFNVSDYEIGERKDSIIKEGINFKLTPIYDQKEGTCEYENYSSAWFIKESEN